MLKIEELNDGDCLVIAKNGNTTKEFKGVYSEDLKVVFFTIPSYYEVIGYRQN